MTALAIPPLTPQQDRFYSLLLDTATDGWCRLSYDEMANKLGLSSKSGISRMVMALEKIGLVKRQSYRARSLQVIARMQCCPSCGHRLDLPSPQTRPEGHTPQSAGVG